MNCDYVHVASPGCPDKVVRAQGHFVLVDILWNWKSSTYFLVHDIGMFVEVPKVRSTINSYCTRMSLNLPATRLIVLSGPRRMCDCTAALDSSISEDMLGQSSVGELKE